MTNTPTTPTPAAPAAEPSAPPSHFIRDIVQEDLKSGKHKSIVTRFPPEPNGYLHIGHAKSICLNFGVAKEVGGICHLRMDDTNPIKEDQEYVDAIIENVKWLGFDWQNKLFFASDYYEQCYQFAVELIQKGKAFVCELSPDEMRAHRGTLTEPGRESPFRNRTVDENLDLFDRMRKGEFPDGSRTLRAKIDMASPNINMRDPVLYRIMRSHHHRTGDTWCIYPMYDFAHPLSDAIEGITHSICTLEFEDHRPLYDWFIDNCSVPAKPRQYEFARLNLTYTLMSKRRLLELVKNKVVRGWDDPRMPTLSGLRRRGFTPEAIRDFCERIGVAKAYSIVDVALLEHCLREDLNKRAPRVMAIVKPLKVVITNYPEGQTEELEAINNPEDPTAGTRKIPFSRVIYLEQDDFKEVPPKGYYRLSPGKEIRLKFAYYITCTNVVKDPTSGEILEVHCTYDPATKGGRSDDGRKVKGTSHWVSAAHAVKAEVRQYESLFTKPNPAEAKTDEEYQAMLNPNSLEILPNCFVEPSLANAEPGLRVQFERTGYFCADLDSKPGAPVFNRTVSLKDTWAKMSKQG